jgi:hypothetical protein
MKATAAKHPLMQHAAITSRQYQGTLHRGAAATANGPVITYQTPKMKLIENPNQNCTRWMVLMLTTIRAA